MGRPAYADDERHAARLVGELGAVLWQPFREGISGEVVGMAEVVDAGHQRAEGFPVAADAADAHAALVDAVVGALTYAFVVGKAEPLPVLAARRPQDA